MLRAGWAKPFVDHLLNLKVGILGEVVDKALSPAGVRSAAANETSDVLKSTGAAVWVLWSEFWWVPMLPPQHCAKPLTR